MTRKLTCYQPPYRNGGTPTDLTVHSGQHRSGQRELQRGASSRSTHSGTCTMPPLW